MFTQLEKRRLFYTRKPGFPLKPSLSRLGFTRLGAVNYDIDLLFPFVNQRQLSDIEAVDSGFVPSNLSQQVMTYWKKIPQPAPNEQLSDSDLVNQAQLSRISLESSERFSLLERAGVFNAPSAPPVSSPNNDV